MAFLEIMTKFNSACVFETVLHMALIEIMRIKDLFSVCDNYSCPRASSIIPMRVCWYVGVQELHSFNASHECHEGQQKVSFLGGTLCTQIEERHEGHEGTKSHLRCSKWATKRCREDVGRLTGGSKAPWC